MSLLRQYLKSSLGGGQSVLPADGDDQADARQEACCSNRKAHSRPAAEQVIILMYKTHREIYKARRGF
jgi:hypothetical protein